MKRFITTAVLVTGAAFVALLTGACEAKTDAPQDFNWSNWSVIKSPLTGRCYEVLFGGHESQGYMAMAEIDCLHYQGETP